VSGSSWGNLPVPPDPLHRSADADERLRRWLRALVGTPGLTAIRDLTEARRALLDDSLRGVDLVAGFEGSIVDVGSGGGVPGIPIAASLPEREVTLLEATGRKCDFLREWAPPNALVVQGRAEEQETDVFGVAVAKALAPPPVAAEWCLPLVRPGGGVVLWAGPSADAEQVDHVARQVGGEFEENRDGLVVLRKVRPTPEGFPRRVGLARKRPLP
jgi:16S rRNA (guanine527-N7)-methyltransferase